MWVCGARTALLTHGTRAFHACCHSKQAPDTDQYLAYAFTRSAPASVAYHMGRSLTDSPAWSPLSVWWGTRGPRALTYVHPTAVDVISGNSSDIARRHRHSRPPLRQYVRHRQTQSTNQQQDDDVAVNVRCWRGDITVVTSCSYGTCTDTS